MNQIEVFYHKVIQVLKGVSLEVKDGQIVALLGANGAGKTTTLKAISGLLSAEAGEVTDGDITYLDRKIHRDLPHVISRMGIIQVLEGRRVFQHLSAEENLRVGYLGAGSEKEIQQRLDTVYNLFPRLAELRDRVSGFLSGGEQQMMVIGRALLSDPKIMLLDEPSLGLAPILRVEVFNKIKEIHAKGMSILLVEQNIPQLAEIAEKIYLMEEGEIVFSGNREEALDNQELKEAFLGM